MRTRSEQARRRSIALKVWVSPDEKATIETHARVARRSVAFMRERGRGLHTGEQLSRLVCADLRRTAFNSDSGSGAKHAATPGRRSGKRSPGRIWRPAWRAGGWPCT